LLGLSARRKEEEFTVDLERSPDRDRAHVGGETDLRPSEGTVLSEGTLGYNIFSKILKNVQAYIHRDGSWQDEAVYGGLIAVRDIPRLGTFLPEAEFLQTLSEAMEKGEEKDEDKPLRVRKAAYDIIQVAYNGWLRSPELRQTLEDLDFPRKLHSVVIETRRLDHERSFLEMMKILSEDRYWHPYLRKAMDIWLPFHHVGRDLVLHILIAVGELLPSGNDGSDDSPPEKSLEKVVEDEWARVPGRLLVDLTADRLEPLAEVTQQFKELFFNEYERKAVLGAVERVIPSLERRRDDDYEGPGDDVRIIITDLLGKLRAPTRHRSGHHW